MIMLLSAINRLLERKLAVVATGQRHNRKCGGVTDGITRARHISVSVVSSWHDAEVAGKKYPVLHCVLGNKVKKLFVSRLGAHLDVSCTFVNTKASVNEHCVLA
jgi:ribosomal protein S12 methylthiotransferase accessory factor YcaO